MSCFILFSFYLHLFSQDLGGSTEYELRPGLMKTLMKPKKTQYSLIDDTDNGIVLGFLL